MGDTLVICPQCNAQGFVDSTQVNSQLICHECNTAFAIASPQPDSQYQATATDATYCPSRESDVTLAPGDNSPDDPFRDWEIGDVILDLYEVKEIFTSGGLGLVYRVHHIPWGIDLAVKRPRPELMRLEQEKQQFELECETWIKLGLHPHVVACHYVRRLDDVPSVFAEFVSGGTLRQWISSGKLYANGTNAALRCILDVAIQMAWGLNFAHTSGLIHQDVKPGNVLMMPDGTAKITDFGLARAWNSDDTPRWETTDLPPGSTEQSMLVSWGGMTPMYCSPEQASREKLTRRTDVWSWAVSVLTMFAGDVIWKSGPDAARFVGILRDGGPVKESLPHLCTELAELLAWCMRPDAADRPSGFDQIANELVRIYQEVNGDRYPRQPPPPTAMLADGMNNRALSLLDLGKRQEAEKTFMEAMDTDPSHPESTYNRGLHLWTAAQLADDAWIRQLREVQHQHGKVPRTVRLEMLAHLARSDLNTVRALYRDTPIPLLDEPSLLKSAVQEKQPGWEESGCVRVIQVKNRSVTKVALSADNRLALGSGFDASFQLIDLESGHVVQEFIGHEGNVTAITFAPDGRTVLSGGEDRRVRLWTMEDGACRQVLSGHTRSVASIHCSHDTQLCLSSCATMFGQPDPLLRLWDLRTATCLRTFNGHTGDVHLARLNKTIDRALSAGRDTSIRLWDLSTGKSVQTFRGLPRPALAIEFLGDTPIAIVAENDNSFCLWNLSLGEKTALFHGHTDLVTSVAISDGGKTVVSGGKDGTVRWWDLESGRCLRTFEGHVGKVNTVTVSQDGRRALSGGDDGTVRLWNLVRGPSVPFVISRPTPPTEAFRNEAEFQRTLAATQTALENRDVEGALALIRQARAMEGRAQAKEALQLLAKAGRHARRTGYDSAWCVATAQIHSDSVTALAMAPDGTHILTASRMDVIRSWSIPDLKFLAAYEGPNNWITSLAISADGSRMLSGSLNRDVQVWDQSHRTRLLAMREHLKAVNAVAISPNARIGLSGGDDRVLRVWDLTTGACKGLLTVHARPVNALAISPDGRWALSGGEDNRLVAWDLANCVAAKVYKLPQRDVHAIHISPHGHQFISADSQGSVHVWDIASTSPTYELKGHCGAVLSVAISACSRWSLTGGADGTMRLWDLAHGRCCRVFEGHTGAVNAVHWSPDSRYAVSAGADGTVRIWELAWVYDFPGWQDWDNKAIPYVNSYLARYEDGVSITDQRHIAGLTQHLQAAGFGWLQKDNLARNITLRLGANQHHGSSGTGHVTPED